MRELLQGDRSGEADAVDEKCRSPRDPKLLGLIDITLHGGGKTTPMDAFPELRGIHSKLGGEIGQISRPELLLMRDQNIVIFPKLSLRFGAA